MVNILAIWQNWPNIFAETLSLQNIHPWCQEAYTTCPYTARQIIQLFKSLWDAGDLVTSEHLLGALLDILSRKWLEKYKVSYFAPKMPIFGSLFFNQNLDAPSTLHVRNISIGFYRYDDNLFIYSKQYSHWVPKN